MKKKKTEQPILFYVLANALVMLPMIYAGVLESSFQDFYFYSIQEDAYMEWATVWAFLFAAAAAFLIAAQHKAETHRLPWYLYGLGLFCLFVALEEFSWGQRIFGYRPPAYFLENNFQQELNIHNVVDSGLRRLGVELTILGYGVVLPLLGAIGFSRDILTRIGVVPATVWLMPAFLATYFLYDEYPWGHTGEWVELMLGSGILFSLLPMLQKEDGKQGKLLARLGGAWTATVILGVICGVASGMQRDVHPAIMQAAKDEVEAIKRDFESGRAETRCNLHKRLYTFVVEYGQPGLYSGEFAALKEQGLPEERADYFIDPWNSPYWLRDRCNRQSRKRHVFIYSFGPDRIRDSTDSEILGDDVGAYIQLR